MEFISKYLMYNFHLVKSNQKGRIHILSKLRFQLYLDCVWRNSIFLVTSLLIYDSRSILKCSHGTFVTFIQENRIPRGKLQLLGFFHYNMWHKMSTLNEINSCIGTLEAWFWYMLFLDPLSAKPCLRFLIELIE